MLVTLIGAVSLVPANDHGRLVLNRANMFLLIATAYLLRYVFQPKLMTQDKLFGAAGAYLLIGVFWAYLYAIIGFFIPSLT